MSPLQSTDLLLVQRGTTQYSATPEALKGFALDGVIIHSPTAPTSPPYTLNAGTIWVDTSKTPAQINAWDPGANNGAGGFTLAAGGGGGGAAGGIGEPPANMPGATLVVEETQFSTATQKIEFSVGSTGTWSDALTAQPGDMVRLRWKAGLLDLEAHNAVAKETVTMTSASSNYVYEYQLGPADKVPDPFTFAPQTDVMFPAPVVAAETITIGNSINAATKLWATTDGGAVEVSINGGAWTAVTGDPATTGARVSPGQTVQYRHTTRNGALLTTTSTLFIGWDATHNESAAFITTNVDSGVVKPSITAPTDGATGIALSPTFVGSAYAAIGAAGGHASSDWQVASDAAFTTIVQQSMANATNKTTWSPPSLASSTVYYVRVKYRETGGLESEWSDVVSFETSHFLTPFVNGSQTFTNEQEWTVPALIGTVRVRFITSWARGLTAGELSGYGTSVFEFNVTPGEKLRLSNLYIGIPDQGGPVRTQACCFVAQGQWGGSAGEGSWKSGDWALALARKTNDCGGQPGAPNGGAPIGSLPPGGYTHATGGTTTTAGAQGSPNPPNYWNSPTNYYDANGGPLKRRASDPYNYACSTNKSYNHNGTDIINGPGGFGWFSGGSGILEQGGGGVRKGGGGGSSFNNIPANRNPNTVQNFVYNGGMPAGESDPGQSVIVGAKAILTW